MKALVVVAIMVMVPLAYAHYQDQPHLPHNYDAVLCYGDRVGMDNHLNNCWGFNYTGNGPDGIDNGLDGDDDPTPDRPTDNSRSISSLSGLSTLSLVGTPDKFDITSIQPYHPTTNTTDSRLLIYNVTFTDIVANVTRTDFTLSPNHANPGELFPTPYTGNSTYAVGDDPYVNGIVDTVNVPVDMPIGNVTVTLDVSNMLAKSLVIRMTPPSGDTVTLHNRTATVPDYLVLNYTGRPSGDWTLELSYDHIVYAGVLDGWSITLEPPTMSCEMASCLVPVFPAGDGLYNLDVIEDNGIMNLDGVLLSEIEPSEMDHTYNVTGLG